MTIIAGVFSKRAGGDVPASVCDALRQGMSRDPRDQPIDYKFPGAYLVKVDIGAFGAPAHHCDAQGCASVMAGEPLLADGAAHGETRDQHLLAMHAQWARDDFSALRHSAGTFCAAFYDPARGTGHLIADRLGLRTLYYAIHGDFVYFSSALRILEALEVLPKAADVQALAEITGFGYPFGPGTPYAGIKMLLPCEVLSIRPEGVTSSRYFEWSSIQPLDVPEEQARAEAYRLFQRAMRRRLHGDRTTFAYLSGGLDSRVVVAALRAEQVHTYTFNYSLAGTQDQVFAKQYAEKCGAVHHELPTEPGPNWSAVMAETWAASTARKARDADRPHVVWTGEGGSVGLGHVYISPEIVRQLRASDWDGGIQTFLNQQSKSVLTRILKPEVARRFNGHLVAALKQEMQAQHQADPVRALYIFLNLNGPRRHLVNHFETIDQHRLEFQLPFYDSEFMEYLTALPADPCLYHGFYVRWLELFDRTVLDVPWQAYPGHVPSPVPVPADVPDQWNTPASPAQQQRLRQDLDQRTRAMLADRSFPAGVLNKPVLRLMHLAWRLGLANYDYALKAALVYARYARASAGRYELPAG